MTSPLRSSSETLTLRDLVLVNGLLIQLYIPLNFLGRYTRNQAGARDMDRMFRLLTQDREIQDRPDAALLAAWESAGSATVRFERVDFSYEPTQILFDVSSRCRGVQVAVVGHSGSGKSTLARLLFRFLRRQRGPHHHQRSDIRGVTQSSLRSASASSLQDTVLFNDTILYNIHIGRPSASHEEVVDAAKAAQSTNSSRPSDRTSRGRRAGLKLPGARSNASRLPRHPKNRASFVFVEATSRSIRKPSRAPAELDRHAAAAHTLVSLIAFHGDGCRPNSRSGSGPVSRARHSQELLAQGGVYAQMWRSSSRRSRADGGDLRSGVRGGGYGKAGFFRGSCEVFRVFSLFSLQINFTRTN